MKIVDATSFNARKNVKQNSLLQLVGEALTNCSASSANQKEWTIYRVIYGDEEQQIIINNNPTINYADLVLQPQTLSNGVYRIVFTVKLAHTNFSASTSTYIQIVSSGLVLSTLKLSQPMFGGTIEITRGQNQKIQFNPYLFTYDIDDVAVITSLKFKYSCQIIESNIPQGYPLKSGTNQTIYLDEFKSNPSFSQVKTCFNSAGNIKIWPI